MAKTLTQIGIETGNTVEAYHVSQSIDAFTGVEAYDISLSGSFNMTGLINGEPSVINPLTASYAMNALTSSKSLVLSGSFAGLTYLYGGLEGSNSPGTARALNSTNLTYNTTTRLLNASSSFAITASHVISASYAVTASHVNLLAGPNITINKVGTTFEISGSGGGGGITPAETGSFYVSSSVNLNTITFHQGDGITESVTVNTGSLSIPSSISQFGGVNIVTITNNYSIPTSGSYRIFNNKTTGAAPNINLPTTSSVGDIIEIIEMPGSARTFIQQNGTLGAGQLIRGFGHSTTRGTTGALVTRSGSLGSTDTNAYLKLICINPGTAASTGQEWKFVEYSSEFWYNQFTNNGVPFDINEIVSFI